MHQNVLIQEDELVSWLQHPQRAGESGFYSGVVASSTLPHNSVSLAPLPPSAPYNPRVENFINFARLREHILTGVEPWIPVMREPTQVGSSATPSSSAYESCLTPATQSRGALISGVSHTFALGKEQAVAMQVREIPGTSSSGVCKAETEPIQIQPATETETADDKKRKERQETIDNIEESKQARGSTSRKRSRTAEMHNISERRRREKINEKMKALQELIPRCNKTDKASMLDDAIEYVKSLQLQIEMMSMGSGILPMMYPPNMQQFMPHMAMEMNRPPFVPFPRQAYMGGLGPSYPASRSPFPSIQASDHSRVHLQTQQPYQPQFPDFMNTYSQFAGLQQMPQPPPLQNQTTSQLTFSQASRSKEPGDQGYQPTGQ